MIIIDIRITLSVHISCNSSCTAPWISIKMFILRLNIICKCAWQKITIVPNTGKPSKKDYSTEGFYPLKAHNCTSFKTSHMILKKFDNKVRHHIEMFMKEDNCCVFPAKGDNQTKRLYMWKAWKLSSTCIAQLILMNKGNYCVMQQRDVMQHIGFTCIRPYQGSSFLAPQCKHKVRHQIKMCM